MVPASPEIEGILAKPLAPDLLARIQALPGAPLAHTGAAYCFAKKGLITYVMNRASEWGQEGKRLMSISPGLIDTGMNRMEADADKAGHVERVGMIALQREGRPEEIASAALFLLSDDASYISGCDLLVDGGCIAGFAKSQGKTVLM